MRRVTMTEARRQLSSLIDWVNETGEVVVITRFGEALAELRQYKSDGQVKQTKQSNADI